MLAGVVDATEFRRLVGVARRGQREESVVLVEDFAGKDLIPFTSETAYFFLLWIET